MGPIPADAGQPSPPPPGSNSVRAYPRGRGATEHAVKIVNDKRGLSPRTRGNHAGVYDALVLGGPIPADAGQPGCRLPRVSFGGAYPRGRGATNAAEIRDGCVVGLSPRTRGNLPLPPFREVLRGPIPADAGQPWACSSTTMAIRAYPRGRGATWQGAKIPCALPGLSPRTRGNLLHGFGQQLRQRPIPADAGQPAACGAVSWACRAYPRGRGATAASER